MTKSDQSRWRALAASSFARATSSLDDAFAQDFEDVPGPVIHSCYLSLAHAAKAYVLARTGVSPKNRKESIKKFFEILPNTKEARGHSETIRYAESLNESEEYDGSVDIMAEEVEALRDDSVGILAYIADLIGVKFAIEDYR